MHDLIAVTLLYDKFNNVCMYVYAIYRELREYVDVSVKKYSYINFTLCLGNLLLRHSVLHFPSNSKGIACWVAELNTTLCFDTIAKKWKYQFLEWGSNPQLHVYNYTLCPCATTGLKYSCIFFSFTYTLIFFLSFYLNWHFLIYSHKN